MRQRIWSDISPVTFWREVVVPFDLPAATKSAKDTRCMRQYDISLPSDSVFGPFPIPSNRHQPTSPIHRARGSSRSPIRRCWLLSSRPGLCLDDRKVLGRLMPLVVLSCIHNRAPDRQQPRKYFVHQQHDLLDLHCSHLLRSTVRMASRVRQRVEWPGLTHTVHLLISIHEQMPLTRGREVLALDQNALTTNNDEVVIY